MKKKSDVSIMLKEAGILFAITLIAGLLLGFVYELTKDPIAVQKELAVKAACKAVFADADSFEEIDAQPSAELMAEYAESGVKAGTVFKALDKSGEELGYVVRMTSTQGYGGNIVLFVGARNDGTLNGISLLEISETPGLGMQAEKVLVPQFENKQVSRFSFTKTGSRSDSEIDAISGATITTRAVTNAVNGGLKFCQELMKGGAANE